jgi:hypothetical protein
MQYSTVVHAFEDLLLECQRMCPNILIVCQFAYLTTVYQQYRLYCVERENYRE